MMPASTASFRGLVSSDPFTPCSVFLRHPRPIWLPGAWPGVTATGRTSATRSTFTWEVGPLPGEPQIGPHASLKRHKRMDHENFYDPTGRIEIVANIGK